MPEEYPPEQGRSLMSEILVICSIGGDGDGDDSIIDRSINTNVRVFPSHFGRTRRSEVDIIARHVIRKKGARDDEGLRE